MKLDELKNVLIFIGFTEERAKRQLVLLSMVAEKRVERSENMSANIVESAMIREYFDNVIRELPFSKKEYVKTKLNEILS
jgi:ATP-dependent Lon protease